MEILSNEKLRLHRVPNGSLTLWWLGQAGFVIKSPGGKLVVVDPYLTNSCKAIGKQFGFNMDRLVPPPRAPAEMVGFDLYAMTHSHGDHLDPETLAGYRAAGGAGPYLAPAETVEKLRQLGVPPGEIILTCGRLLRCRWGATTSRTSGILWASRTGRRCTSREARAVTTCWLPPPLR